MLILSDVMLRLPFPWSQHVVKWIMTDALSQSLYPVIFLFLTARRHFVNRMFAFHYFPFRVRFTRFNKVCTAACVKFETELFWTIRRLPHQNVLQRDYTSWFFVRGELKIIKAVVIEDKPASFPVLVATALFP